MKARSLFLILSFFAFAMVAEAQATTVVFETTHGSFEIELESEKSPLTVANFLKYVEDDFYVGTVFHRVIPGFVVQGGGLDADLVERETRAPVPNESQNGLSNTLGTVAMARAADPHSASAQFYVNLKNNPRLDAQPDGTYGYTVFGRVSSGFEVIESIAKVERGTRGEHEDVPIEPIQILRTFKK